MKISMVVSTRDNIKYLKWSYDSIRKNQGNHEVWICYGIDHCTDGTQDWIKEIKKIDPFVKSIENVSGKRVGHTLMYDRIINEIVETDLAMIFHSDMYLCPDALGEVEKLMYAPESFEIAPDDWMEQLIEIPNRIVSLTRIEPPLHPPDPAKIVAQFGQEPEEFDEIGLLAQLHVWSKLDKWKQVDAKGREFYVPLQGTTSGIFAPWAFWVDEFQAIGGHDPLFSPQSKEDSDIFNRFRLKFGDNCFIQPRNAYVYHLTCRGSRFSPAKTTVGTNSDEWNLQNIRSERNFIRKWGSNVKHDEYYHPIIPHKYRTEFRIKNCTSELLYHLEPWCDTVLTDLSEERVVKYIQVEQPNTQFQLAYKIDPQILVPEGDIIVNIDCQRFDQNDWKCIQQLSEILTDSGEIGTMQVGNLLIEIKALTHYENELIVCNNQ